MSINTALSGIIAAQRDMSATSHNIANVSTTGFRSSRVEFADVFHSSPYGISRTAVGSGVQVTRVSQQFAQGNVVTTGNRLDLAIEGQGFFALRPTLSDMPQGTAPVYTRAGAFGLNPAGEVVNGAGQALLAFPVARDGAVLSTAMAATGTLRVPFTAGEPAATSAVSLNVALPEGPEGAGGQTAVPPGVPFSPADPTSYAFRSAIPVLDASGTPVQAEVAFVRVADPTTDNPETTYEMHLLIGGEEVAPRDGTTPPRLSFDAAGALVAGTAPAAFGPAASGLTVDMAGSTLDGTSFAVIAADRDGATPAALAGVDVDPSGTVWASYDNGRRDAVGRVAMVNFANPQGLQVMGNATFGETVESGDAIGGTAGSTGFGALRSGALERSNVELTEELVNLITAQRNYQASAKAMETTASLMQTIMNIRG